MSTIIFLKAIMIRRHVHMMSAKFSEFWTPSPLVTLYTISLTQLVSTSVTFWSTLVNFGHFHNGR